MSATTSATTPPLRQVQIPCCLCGTMILPNAANQCPTCLAQEFNLTEQLQRGPAGSSKIVVHQCRNCRRYARTPARYDYAEPESPELLSICLKQIPALNGSSNNSNNPPLHLVDASWIWTEPHSMRLKLRLTVRTELLSVVVQQRVAVELHVQFQMCNECNREFTNRTWHALVQVRQDRDHKKGLAALEMALARHPAIRQHVLKIDTAKNGFDFYFLSTAHAQAFTHFLQRVAAMRIVKTSKLVSSDSHNNTANLKTTYAATMVPLCRDDLVLIHKRASGNKLSGSLVLVSKVASSLQFVAAAPNRTTMLENQMEVSADQYYKTEKSFEVLQSAHRMIRFVVLDVELCDQDHQHRHDDDDDVDTTHRLYKGPASGVEKYALADVTVARESDFGVNDEVFTCVTHLGHLISVGDVVLGYDLLSTVGMDWEMQEKFHSGFTMPDVVLVKRVGKENASAGGDSSNSSTPPDESRQKRTTKKRERRKRRNEGKKQKELEDTAVRMGFFAAEGEEESFDAELGHDPELAAELSALERDFASLGPGNNQTGTDSGAGRR